MTPLFARDALMDLTKHSLPFDVEERKPIAKLCPAGDFGRFAGDCMTLSDKLEVPVGVMARQVGEQPVMLHLGSGTPYGLDPVAARGWPLLIEGNSLAEIGGAMEEATEAGQGNREGTFWTSRAG